MKSKLLISLIFLVASMAALAQTKATDIGLEMQVYPTGTIPGIRAEKSINKHDLGSIRLGYQIIDHRDLGRHDEETGYGYGGTLGYKHYFAKYFTGLCLTVRADVWYNFIDWKTITDSGTTTGVSKIVVLQPTAELGWAFGLNEHVVLTPAVALGFEKNIHTKGEETGEGMVMLGGITASYRID